MRLSSEKLNVEKSGIGVETEFKIKATAKAFGILSSGLYSNKIRAIIRELCCNAWDAHVAAGNTETPFELKLPTSLDPTFYVKDFGIGLTHEEVLNLYTTYFDSTKSDSNEFIGALGLGSKSPFSYVSTFSVESRYSGMKRLYSSFIGETGVPSIALLGTEKTDEPNGMTISLGTKSGDADKFRMEAMYTLMYFNPLPKVYGGGSDFKPYSLKHTVEGTNWKVRETEYYSRMSGAYVVQGFVAYPVDRDNLAQNGLSQLANAILQLPIDFTVTIGAVEMAASREALSYTKSTIQNLIKVVEVAAVEMRASIQKEFDNCKTLWEARLMNASFGNREHKMASIYSELSRSKSFTYKGKDIATEIPLDLTKIHDTQIAVSYLSHYSRRRKTKASKSGGWDPQSTAKSFTLNIHPGMTVLVDDVYGSAGLLTQYLEGLRKPQGNGNQYVMVIKGLTKKTYNQKEIDAIISQLGDAPYELVSALPYIKTKTAYAYRARKHDEVLVWSGYSENAGYRRNQIRRVYSRLCWTSGKADTSNTTKEQFYVNLERFKIMRKPDLACEAFDLFLDYMQGIGIIPKDTTIIGLNEKQSLRAKSNKKWNELFKYCEDAFTELNKDGTLSAVVLNTKMQYYVGAGIAQRFVRDWAKISKQVTDGSFKSMINDLHALHTAAEKSKLSSDTIVAAANNLTSPFDKNVQKRYADVTKEFDKVMGENSMLRIVNWEKVAAGDIDMIVKYVNFVAKG